MKRTRAIAAAVVLTAGLSATACSSDDADDNTAAETTAEQTTEQTPLPTAQELGEILDRAVAPDVAAEEKADTVENGEQAVELFDVMIQSQQESGATFEVVDPILPGVTPQEVTATMNLIQPDAEPVRMDGVKFVNDNGQWKLSQEWACTLVSNVAPDQVPDTCAPFLEDAPAPAGDAPAPEGDAPAAPAA
ncbi:hypothetical protein BJF89_06840 [Corynebacterium sp. CNJ-954]|nr:hypothetical protein [Corynebacterium sp. CNJ-954]OLT51436.1 hypothetical protein BJF89_06840 [Corynebacterium sp. CNJ-954]